MLHLCFLYAQPGGLFWDSNDLVGHVCSVCAFSNFVTTKAVITECWSSLLQREDAGGGRATYCVSIADPHGWLEIPCPMSLSWEPPIGPTA